LFDESVGAVAAKFFFFLVFFCDDPDGFSVDCNHEQNTSHTDLRGTVGCVRGHFDIWNISIDYRFVDFKEESGNGLICKDI
jgi:hypothetical protein